MTRTLLAILTGIALTTALGADPNAVIKSAAPFEGAVEGISDITTIEHLPGYGLNINARYCCDFDVDTVVEQLTTVVVGLSPLVQGLDQGDLVSVAWTGSDFIADDIHIVVRMQPGQPGTLEVFVNGQQR